MSAKTYRVVQWATGNIGTRSLRAVIEHPNLELVGLYVHSPDKAGKDAGELCGAGITRVIATNSIDEIVALGQGHPRTTMLIARETLTVTLAAARAGGRARWRTRRPGARDAG